MGPPCNASHLTSAQACVEELHKKPEPQKDIGRKLHKIYEKEDWNKSKDLGPGVEYEVGTITPATAPLAPIVGRLECQLVVT